MVPESSGDNPAARVELCSNWSGHVPLAAVHAEFGGCRTTLHHVHHVKCIRRPYDRGPRGRRRAMSQSAAFSATPTNALPRIICSICTVRTTMCAVQHSGGLMSRLTAHSIAVTFQRTSVPPCRNTRTTSTTAKHLSFPPSFLSCRDDHHALPAVSPCRPRARCACCLPARRIRPPTSSPSQTRSPLHSVVGRRPRHRQS